MPPFPVLFGFGLMDVARETREVITQNVITPELATWSILRDHVRYRS
jgi:hypothetical protein